LRCKKQPQTFKRNPENKKEAAIFPWREQSFRQSSKTGKQINGESPTAITETYIGQINVKLKKYSTALKYYFESLIYFKKEDKFQNVAMIGL
jgi:hypothetical protein